MYLIKKKEELHENIKQIDEYLTNKIDPKYNYALDLIKRGTCFVALADEFDRLRWAVYHGIDAPWHIPNTKRSFENFININ